MVLSYMLWPKGATRLPDSNHEILYARHSILKFSVAERSSFTFFNVFEVFTQPLTKSFLDK
jgi:hypothetical protein